MANLSPCSNCTKLNASSADFCFSCQHPMSDAPAHVDRGEKYRVLIRNRYTGDTLEVDTYDMLVALNITCPALAHAFKKIANPGKRGAKDFNKDCNEAINSVEQAKLLQKYREE